MTHKKTTKLMPKLLYRVQTQPANERTSEPRSNTIDTEKPWPMLAGIIYARGGEELRLARRERTTTI